MTPERVQEITARYARLRVAVVGDYCLDRYLEIDPARTETSLETGRTVRNVVRVRAQPGAAGTILNNLAALGVGTLLPVGFCGEDGEGFELQRALAALPGVRLDHFRPTPTRRTFTYCKPLVVAAGRPPEELDRLDSKNWTPTPAGVQADLVSRVNTLIPAIDAVMVISRIPVTTAEVAAWPTASALRPHCMPRRQPAKAIIALDKFGKSFENETVSGTTSGVLGTAPVQSFAWPGKPDEPNKLLLPWPAKPAANDTLQLAHDKFRNNEPPR